MSDPHVALIATSLDASSRSQILARAAAETLAERGIAHTLLDLRDPELRTQLRAVGDRATHFLFAVPIYNFNVSGATKEAVEVLDAALANKTVGFICSAGGARSYMSVLGLANSLMLDFRSWIVPRFVYATGGDFENDLPQPAIRQRIAELIEDLLSR